MFDDTKAGNEASVLSTDILFDSYKQIPLRWGQCNVGIFRFRPSLHIHKFGNYHPCLILRNNKLHGCIHFLFWSTLHHTMYRPSPSITGNQHILTNMGSRNISNLILCRGSIHSRIECRSNKQNFILHLVNNFNSLRGSSNINRLNWVCNCFYKRCSYKELYS